MEKGRRDTVLLTVIAIATLLVAIVGATFAYFTAQLNGQNRTSAIQIQASSGATVTYYSASFTESNMYPRAKEWALKPFRLDYVNQYARYDYQYDLYLHYNNEFANSQVQFKLNRVTGYCSDALYATESACTSASKQWNTTNVTQNGAVSDITATYINNGISDSANPKTNVHLGTGTFYADAQGGSEHLIHAYTLTILYPNKANENQNSQQGKALSVWIEAVEKENRTA